MAICRWRSLDLWLLGYPDAALADTNRALKNARESAHAATLMYALDFTSFTQVHLRKLRGSERAIVDEFIALADEKGAVFWKAMGVLNQGCVLALTGKAAEAVKKITSGIAAIRSTGATRVDAIVSCHIWQGPMGNRPIRRRLALIDEAMTAMETTKERWCEAEVNRIAGEITLMSPEPEAAKAQAYFERALSVARQQQAKSWELRAAMSLARLWRDQGKVQQARELLAPVYGWFTEGFDTRDLKEAKALLEELVS